MSTQPHIVAFRTEVVKSHADGREYIEVYALSNTGVLHKLYTGSNYQSSWNPITLKGLE